MKNNRLKCLILSAAFLWTAAVSLPVFAINIPGGDAVTNAVAEKKRSPWVSNVSLLTYIHEETGETFIISSFELNLDGLKKRGLTVQLPTVTIPVYDSRNNFDSELGTIQVLGLSGAINLRINLTSFGFGRADEAGYGMLPDGSPIPIAGLARVDTLEVPIPYTDEDGNQKKHSVYLAVDAREGVSMIGVALTLKAFDGMARTFGGADLFLPFEFSKMNEEGTQKRTVRGAAGFFGHKDQTGKSGLAFFIDIGGVIAPQAVEDLLEGNTETVQPPLRRTADSG